MIHFAYGTQAYRGDYHLTSFTPILLSHYLATAGLFVHRVSVRDDWLYEIDARRIPAPTRVSWPMPSLAVDAIYRSASWRMTALLRAVRRLTRWMVSSRSRSRPSANKTCRPNEFVVAQMRVVPLQNRPVSWRGAAAAADRSPWRAQL